LTSRGAEESPELFSKTGEDQLRGLNIFILEMLLVLSRVMDLTTSNRTQTIDVQTKVPQSLPTRMCHLSNTPPRPGAPYFESLVT
jgi:hypothetical protein